MKTTIITIILFCFYVLGFSQIKDLNSGFSSSKTYAEDINFEFIKNKIILPVEIEGITYRFLLDTGAPTILSKELADLLKSEVLQEIPVVDGSGKKDSLSVVSIKKLTIGNTSFENALALSYDFKENPIFDCFNIDGFIGSNLLRNSIIQIDLKNRSLHLSNHTKELNLSRKNSSKLILKGSQSSPYIKIKLQGKSSINEEVLIDTGMDGLYDLSLDIYKNINHKDIFYILGESEGASSISLFGDVPVQKHYRLQLPIMHISNLELLQLKTVTTNDNNSRLGVKLLDYGIMTLDFLHKKFYFEPYQTSISVDKPSFGFSRTLINDRLVIGFVWDEDLKEKMNYGDTIIAINEVQISNLSICDLINQEETNMKHDSITLTIKSVKTGEISELTVTKK